jgi:signal transduction histidine kinase
MQLMVHLAGNFLSNAVKFTPAGGKLDLKVHCEKVVEKKHVDLPFIHETPSSSSESVTRTGDPLLGVTGTSILTKTSSQTKQSIDKVARIYISVKDNGIGEYSFDCFIV